MRRSQMWINILLLIDQTRLAFIFPFIVESSFEIISSLNAINYLYYYSLNFFFYKFINIFKENFEIRECYVNTMGCSPLVCNVILFFISCNADTPSNLSDKIYSSLYLVNIFLIVLNLSILEMIIKFNFIF